MRLRLWGAVAACLLVGLAAHAEPFDEFVLGQPPATSTLGATDAMPVIQGGETRQLFPQSYFMRPDGTNATLPAARTAILPTPTLDNCLVGNGEDWTSASCPGSGDMLPTAANATLPAARANLLPGSVTALFYAKDYGSCTWNSTNDVGACINLAIDAAVAAGGGKIVMPPGIFGLTVAPTITANSVGIECAAPSVTEGAGGSTVNSNGTELKWIGASGGRMMSVATSAGQLLGSFVKNCRFNGNAGLAADGLYVASTFGGHFDDLTFFGGFNSGTIFNIDVNALAAYDAQNNTFDNLYLNNGSGGGNGPGPYTSQQFRLGGFMDGTGQHGNASYNYGRNIFVAGDAATTGILCVGCDNNRLSDVRVFNSGTSIDLTIAQNGANLFPANGNIFDHVYYNGAFQSRGTASFAACSGITCAYNNSLSIDSTNGTPAPTIEAGSFLHWNSNSGYWANFSLIGKATVQPALFAAHDPSIWGACRDNARTYASTGVAYLCDSSGGNLLSFDDIVGDRFAIRFYGAAGAANLLFERLAGTGGFVFNATAGISGLSTGVTSIGQLGGSSDYSGIAFTTSGMVDVSAANYSLLGEGVDTYVNAPTGGTLRLRAGNADRLLATSFVSSVVPFQGSQSLRTIGQDVDASAAGPGGELRWTGSAVSLFSYNRTSSTYQPASIDASSLALNINGGNVTMAGGGTVTGLPSPSAASDAVPKTYADSIAAGIVTHAAAAAATTPAFGNLTATASGTGPGKTLTNSGAQAAFATDGYSGLINDRILVKNQTAAADNGIYTLTTVGTGATNWVLTRATDFDAASSSEVGAGGSVIVINGTAHAATNWVETGQGPFTLETTPIVFSQVLGGSSGGTISSGTTSQIGYYAANGTTISGLTTGNNGVLATNGSGAPSITSTLPNAVQDNITRLGTVATGGWAATPIAIPYGGTGVSLAATGGTSQVVKQVTLGGNITVGTLTSGDLTMTATNDNAASGKLGEYITGSATAVPLTSGATQTNITSISLTAGDWDVTASVKFNPAATTTSTVRIAGVTTTSATMPTTLATATALARFTGAITAGQGSHVLNTDAARMSLAGTTTVYCVGQFTFATSTATADCLLRARRVR